MYMYVDIEMHRPAFGIAGNKFPQRTSCHMYIIGILSEKNSLILTPVNLISRSVISKLRTSCARLKFIVLKIVYQ